MVNPAGFYARIFGRRVSRRKRDTNRGDDKANPKAEVIAGKKERREKCLES